MVALDIMILFHFPFSQGNLLSTKIPLAFHSISDGKGFLPEVSDGKGFLPLNGL